MRFLHARMLSCAEKLLTIKGFVMALYSTLQARPNATEEELLESINANLCRCTGYRPIVSALKEISQKAKAGAKIAGKYDFPEDLKNKSSFAVSGQRVQW